MKKEIEKQMDLLYSNNNSEAYQALKVLEEMSNKSSSIYPYMNRFVEMLSHTNSYIRNRGLLLIACNAKWDTDYKIDEIIDEYMKHVTDVKPITARQCIKASVIIAKYKSDLKSNIIAALRKADISFYTGSMQSLVYKDIQIALSELQSQKD